VRVRDALHNRAAPGKARLRSNQAAKGEARRVTEVTQCRATMSTPAGLGKPIVMR
jgi:hypothetical protein